MKNIGKSMVVSAAAVVAVSSASSEVYAAQPNAIGVGTSTLYIRSGASSKHDVIVKVPKGSEIEVMSETNNKGWAKARYKGKSGWVYMPKVEEKKLASGTRYVSNVHRINLREKPTSKSASLGYLYEGEKVEVIDYTGSYARIKYNGKVYYTLKSYLEKKNPAQTRYVSGVWRKVLKSGYVSTSKTLGYVMEGSKVTVVGYREGFAHIIYNGKRYYVKNSDLVAKNPVVYKYVDGVEKLPVMNGNGKVVAYLGKGQKVKTFGVKDGKTRISYDGKTGFIKGTSGLGEYTTKVVEGIDILSVYESANQKKEIGSLYEGMSITVISEENGWSKIKYGDITGYVKSEYLKQIKYVESKEKVALRKSVDITEDNIICYMSKGEKVEVTSYKDGMAKVKYGSKTGYVENECLVFGKSGSNESIIEGMKADSSNYKLRYTIKDSVKVYKNPLVNDSLHGYLTKGTAVEYISHLDNDYTKVAVNGSVVGYVKRSELSHRNPLAKNTTSTTYKNTGVTHSAYLKTQEGKPYTNFEDVKYYSNPLNFSMENGNHKYQFLKLNTFREVNAYELNVYLSNLSVNPGNTAIFKGQASAFISAAKKYNIDPIYLVSHTLLETGYGNSELAQGIIVTEDAAGNKITPTKVHNLFGIGAIDADAKGGGSKTAYALGWTDIPKAIEGAAKWISEGVPANESVGLKKSDGYINSKKHTHQYTLYAMRWDYVNSWHQYATDPQWAVKISRLMNKLSYMYEGASLVFEIPVYAQEKEIQIMNVSEDIAEEEINNVDVDENEIVIEGEDISQDICEDAEIDLSELDNLLEEGNDIKGEELEVSSVSVEEEIEEAI